MFDKNNLKLTAEQAKSITEVFQNNEETTMNSIYDMIMDSCMHRKRHVNVSFVTKTEAKELLDSGFRLYDADGTNQYTKPDAFTYDFEARIEW